MGYIIVDTSSILFGLENKVDIFKEADSKLGLSPIISKGVVMELTKISSSKRQDRKYAIMALKLIAEQKVKIESDTAYVDEWIIRAATKYGNVCTNDTKLRKALKSKGVSIYSVSMGGSLRYVRAGP